MKSNIKVHGRSFILGLLLVTFVLLLPLLSHAGGGGSAVDRNVMPDGLMPQQDVSQNNNAQCQRDAKVCPDGTTVGRTGPNCTFAPCTGGPLPPPNNNAVCPQDAKVCPDGTTVTRTGPSCSFPACSGGSGVIYGDVDVVDSTGSDTSQQCPAIQCPNGTFVSASAGPTCPTAEVACGTNTSGAVSGGTTGSAGGSVSGSDTVEYSPATVVKKRGFFGTIAGAVSGATQNIAKKIRKVGATITNREEICVSNNWQTACYYAPLFPDTSASVPYVNPNEIPGAVGDSSNPSGGGDYEGGTDYNNGESYACTMDAMQCPDGSYVGRTGPNCEFICGGVNTNPSGGNDTESSSNFDLSPKDRGSLTAAASLGIDVNIPVVQASIILAGRDKTQTEFKESLQNFLSAYPNLDMETTANNAALGISGTTNSQRAAEALRAMAGFENDIQGYTEAHGDTLRYVDASAGGTVSSGGSTGTLNATTPSSGSDGVMCTQEMKQCSDGSFVGRTGPNCAFATCPSTPRACTEEAIACPDGSTTWRTGPNCTYTCPGTNAGGGNDGTYTNWIWQ